MAKEYTLEIMGQPSRYGKSARPLTMYFSEPEAGAGEETGICLFIAGYGGHASSNVYKKMRDRFAEEYNLVTVQVDYLGSSFMQNDQHMPVTEEVLRNSLSQEEFGELLKDFAGNQHILQDKVLEGYVELKETDEDYNEMGLIQAMDNLMAVKILMDVMQENGISWCKTKVLIYGQSHGAYLAYLCNFLAPGLFSTIIENSAYLVPHYLFCDREVIKQGELFTLRKLYHYMVRGREIDLESYDLEKLYQGFHNQARILVFHGAEDTMIPIGEKKAFLEKISGVMLHEITKEQVDGRIFKSADHSLGADLLEVFRLAMQELKEQSPEKEGAEEDVMNSFALGEIPSKEWEPQNKSFQTSAYIYEVQWDSGIPLLYIMEK